MICEICDGKKEVNGEKCDACEGMGALCDVCGDSCDEAKGQDEDRCECCAEE